MLVLERAGAGGGASAMAGGEIYMGGGTAVQKACGFDDTPEAMYAFLMAATGPGPTRRSSPSTASASVEHFDWLVDCGVVFKANLLRDPCWEPPTDDGLVYTGGENAWPFNQIARPPRGHVPQIQHKRPGEKSGGMDAHAAPVRHGRGRGAGSRCPTPGWRSLVVDDDRPVVGRDRPPASATDLAVRARRGVVLASGGFMANADMVAQHAPLVAGQMLLGTDGDDGTSIRLGQGLGAAGAPTWTPPRRRCPAYPPLVYPSLLVNQFGQRFINEDTYCGRSRPGRHLPPAGPAAPWSSTRRSSSRCPRRDRWGARPPGCCQTVAELEAEMGLPVGSLQATVELYNRHADAGEDPVFHKRAEYLRPLKAPFGAIRPHRLPYAVFTLGGLVTTVDGEVVGPGGRPIPGCTPPAGPPRASRRGATPAGPRSATAPSSAAGPAGPPAPGADGRSAGRVDLLVRPCHRGRRRP